MFKLLCLLDGILGEVKGGEILVVMGFSGFGKFMFIDVFV